MMRSKATLVMLVLAGTVLSACAADPDYDSSQFAYGYPVYQDPPYGYFDFDYWGGDWHQGWDHDHWHGHH
jgi:hypothetical protein